MIYNLLAISVFLFLIRWLIIIGKNHEGVMSCSTWYGKLIGHWFVAYEDERVCKICGLIQESRPPFMAMLGDDDEWFDKGYAENKEEMIQNIIKKIKRDKKEEQANLASYKKKIRENIIPTRKSIVTSERRTK